MDPVIAAIGTGIVFGLSAGLSPGPLMALVMTQTLRHGTGAGIRVAIAPLITDLPIVLVTTFVVGRFAGSNLLLGLISVAGATFVAWIAAETIRARPMSGERATAAAPRSVSRGVVVNLLSPHPYLFWLTVGAPTLIAAWAAGPGVAAGFLVAFYGCLIGSKVGLAVVTSTARGRLAGRGYRWLMLLLGGLLAAFAATLFIEGVSLLRA